MATVSSAGPISARKADGMTASCACCGRPITPDGEEYCGAVCAWRAAMMCTNGGADRLARLVTSQKGS